MILEVCCGSVEEAVVAAESGVDRIELCSGLPTGGVTCTLGQLVEVIERTSVPVVAMVRPREGGPCLPEEDFRAALRDIELLVDHGAHEIICGVLDPNHQIDMTRNREMVSAAKGRPVAFHRVFDMTPDLHKSLDRIIELGFQRVLTSGGSPTVTDGLKAIASLIELSGDRITILPGGGVRPTNALNLLKVGARELHFSSRAETMPGYAGIADFEPNRQRIAEMKSVLSMFLSET